VKRVNDSFAALAEWLQDNQGMGLIVMCWVFLAATAVRAQHSLFWYDELLTVKISALPRFSDVWAALRAGLDLNPPFQYLAVRAVETVMGENALSIRLPMILGTLVMSVCLFLYLRRRAPAGLAFAGLTLPWLTEAYRYALNARPYGILLGAGGLVFLFWSRAAEFKRRGFSLAGLSVSLAIVIATHAYGILILAPIAAGEVVRLTARRRPDWPMWMAIALGITPVALYPMLSTGGSRVPASSTLHVSLWTAPEAYASLLAPLLWPALLGAVAVLLFARSGVETSGSEEVPPRHELAALAGFAAIPILAVVVAMLTTGVFTLRYAVLAIFGISALLVLAVPRRSRAPAGAALTVIFLGFFTTQFAAQLWWASRGAGVELFHLWPARRGVVEAAAPVASAPANGESVPGHPLLTAIAPENTPLVVSSGLAFLEIEHYASPKLMARTYYVTDGEAAIRRTGTARFEITYPRMKPLLRLRGNVEPAATFLAQHPRFLVYSPGYLVEWRVPDEWLLPELESRGWHVRPIARQGRAVLAEVTAP
jgi:hypothetical protein